MWFWSSVWIYYAALGFTKLSILLQYLYVSKFCIIISRPLRFGSVQRAPAAY
jgi:hypothetical protein